LKSTPTHEEIARAYRLPVLQHPPALTPGEASVLLRKLAVQPGTTIREILEAVAKGWFFLHEAAVLLRGGRSSQPRSSTPGVTYGLLDEGGHQESVEVHPSEGALPSDAPSDQEAPATAQPEGKPTRRKASRRRKRT
jgi:hypothetical protein